MPASRSADDTGNAGRRVRLYISSTELAASESAECVVLVGSRLVLATTAGKGCQGAGLVVYTSHIYGIPGRL